eukprot:3123420-Pyramimonas_sp.AAC.1
MLLRFGLRSCVGCVCHRQRPSGSRKGFPEHASLTIRFGRHATLGEYKRHALVANLWENHRQPFNGHHFPRTRRACDK